MSVWNKRISGLAAAMILVSGIVGCAGSGKVPSPQPGSVAVSGGIPESGGTSTKDVAPSTSTQEVELTVDGKPTTVILPADTGLANDEDFALLPEGAQFFLGMTVPGGRLPGDFYLDGKKVSNLITAGGKLRKGVIIKTGHHFIRAVGPFEVKTGGQVLTIQEIDLDFWAKAKSKGKVLVSLPTALDGEIPSNGSSTLLTNLTPEVLAYFNSYWEGGSANLSITKTTGDLSKTVSVTDGIAAFNDLVDNGNTTIPRDGVNIVTFTYTPAP